MACLGVEDLRASRAAVVPDLASSRTIRQRSSWSGLAWNSATRSGTESLDAVGVQPGNRAGRARRTGPRRPSGRPPATPAAAAGTAAPPPRRRGEPRDQGALAHPSGTVHRHHGPAADRCGVQPCRLGDATDERARRRRPPTDSRWERDRFHRLVRRHGRHVTVDGHVPAGLDHGPPAGRVSGLAHHFRRNPALGAGHSSPDPRMTAERPEHVNRIPSGGARQRNSAGDSAALSGAVANDGQQHWMRNISGFTLPCP
ncbi:hypothetical protein EDD40_7707 [Saccharothrix texasensis]|uniref:Uncharacterized protein n=1 Tax=Saccharothrix texasensis TaxID=103734 RepID=A0A3N1HID0_9PSEU|nr:hypothetical protein EDD40_7707 [Saccharothrix texasensis]